MAFFNRKLLYYSFLPQVTNSSQPCPPLCIPSSSCPPGCFPVIILPPEPQPLPYVILPDHDHRRPHPYPTLFLVCVLVLIVLSTLLLMFNVVYARILRSRRRSNTMRPILNPPQGLDLAHDHRDRDHDHWDLLLDEQQRAMVVDHHVWYINTVGLPPSVIESIALCKYKRGDGLVDGTDCAVCLSEFEEGENLRVLPKCNHAFHVPCIDTWLRSHTNCPMCRAPVMSSTPNNPNLRLPQPPLSGLNLSLNNHDHGEDNRSSGRDLRSDVEEGRDGLMDTKVLRRTFSMESALNSSLVCSPSHIESVEISRVADSMIGCGGEEGSCSSSSSSLLQRGLGSMKRSLSCTGTLLSSSYA